MFFYYKVVKAFLNSNKVKLQNVNSLTFRKHEYTKHRRVPAVLQVLNFYLPKNFFLINSIQYFKLRCLSGCHFAPQKVDCFNQGFQNNNIKVYGKTKYD